MAIKPENTEVVVQACVCLHNLLRMRKVHMDVDVEDEETHEVTPGVWRLDPSLPNLGSTPFSGRSTQVARAQRDYMKDYFCSPQGSVAWQDKMIE